MKRFFQNVGRALRGKRALNPNLGPNQQAWVDALRSGQYAQTQRALQHVEAKDGFEAGFCCLGVACDMFTPEDYKMRIGNGVNYYGEPATLPREVQKILGMKSGNGTFVDGEYEDRDTSFGAEVTILGRTCLTELNDMNKLSFTEIADVIENNHELLFKEKV